MAAATHHHPAAVRPPPAEAGRPIQLLAVTPEGRFAVPPEAQQALARVQGPVGAVAVVGRARQGKSYLLNALRGKGGGFAVSPTQRPCTKGIWMWSDPLPMKDEDGREFHSVLLDTEGIDAYDQTGQYSTQIFSLAMLLSSVFVFNQMGGIDEASLDRLSLVVEMSKHIRTRTGSANDDERANNEQLATMLPPLVWLCRDFCFALEDDEGRPITSAQYLEDALAATPGTSDSIKNKNRIRESIKALFPRRECMTLVRPVSDESKLKRLASLPLDELRPEFTEGLERFTERIFKLVAPLRLDGSGTLTGAGLARLAETYADALNRGAVPTIANAWQSVAEAECRRALDEGLTAGAAALAEAAADSLAADADGNDALGALRARALEAAHRAFEACAMGSSELRASFLGQLDETVTTRWEELKARVDAAAELRCVEAVRTMEARLRAAVDAPDTNAESLLAAVDGMRAEYDAACPVERPAKHRLWADFCTGALRDALPRLCASAADAVRKELGTQLDAARSEVTRLQTECVTGAAELATLRNEAELWQRRLDDQASASNALVGQLREAAAARRDELDHIMDQLAESEKRRIAAEQDVLALKARADEAAAQSAASIAGAARREQRLAEVLAGQQENLVALHAEATKAVAAR